MRRRLLNSATRFRTAARSRGRELVRTASAVRRAEHVRDALALLGRAVPVAIDRPLGSTHPRWPDLVYRINYGHVPGTVAPDGEEIDAYVLGVTRRLRAFEGICVAVVERLDDVECKLVVARSGSRPSPRAVREAVRFQERHFSIVVHGRARGDTTSGWTPKGRAPNRCYHDSDRPLER